jgi:hypothetical protein
LATLTFVVGVTHMKSSFLRSVSRSDASSKMFAVRYQDKSWADPYIY